MPIKPVMKLGYARVSTHDQSLDLQIDALTSYKVDRIFTDTISGKTVTRIGLDDCLSHLREGDSLVVWKLDRLGRSLQHLTTTVADLKGRGIEFVSLKENIDTSTAIGKFTFHLFAAISEFERDLIRERTNAGLTAARSRGRKGGRKQALTDEQIKSMIKIVKSGVMPITELAEQYGIHRNSIYGYLRKYDK